MKTIYFCVFVLYLVHLLSLNVVVYSQDESTVPTGTDAPFNNNADNESEVIEYEAENSYCYRFTWLGPEYNNDSVKNGFNVTCQDLKDEKRFVNVPCRMPLVITEDGTRPDIEYLWNNYKSNVLCRRANGQVCAKYSYSFNNKVQNVTYMCTRVYDKDYGVVTSGCYKFKQNGFDVSLCVCESAKGGYRPCNSAFRLETMSYLLYFITFLAILKQFNQSI